MALFDSMPGMDTPEGQGLLAAAFSLLQARRMPGERGIGGALGAAGQQYMGTRSQAQDQMQRRKAQDMQMEAQRMQMDEQRRAAAQRLQMETLAGKFAMPGTAGYGANEMDSVAVPAKPASYDFQGYANALAGINPQASLGILQQLQKDESPITVGEGATLLDRKTLRPVFSNPKPVEAKSLPAALQEYEYAKNQGYKGTFEQWDTARKRAGATNLNVNTDNLGLKPKDRFDMEQKLAADYQKATGTDRAIVSTAQDVENILKQGGALKDQAAIYKFAKALDPEGAVREADYAAIVRTAGGLDYVQNLFNRALTGEQLSPKQRGEMSSLMNSMAGVARKRIAANQKTFSGNAKMYNLEPSNVFQASETSAGAVPGVDALVDKYRSKK